MTQNISEPIAGNLYIARYSKGQISIGLEFQVKLFVTSPYLPLNKNL